MTRTKIIAHRGASGYAPENTLPAFRKAVEMCADGIELDVHMSKDGNIIIMHDEWVNRTSSGTGLIKEMTLAELKRLDCGKWYGEEFEGTRIPILEEVLNALRDWNGFLNIEIKEGSAYYPGIEKRCIDIVKQFCFEENVMFSSFKHNSMSDIKSNASYLRVGLLYNDKLDKPWEYARMMRADALHPPYFYVDQYMAECCRAYNIDINAWTVNDEKEMARLIDLNINGIITNYPDIAYKIRG